MTARVLRASRSWFALALVATACASRGEDSEHRDRASSAVHVCFELRDGAPMGDGLNLHDAFYQDGDFLPGIDELGFDSGRALVDVLLNEGVDGQSWAAALPSEILDAEVLSQWFVSDREC